MNISVVILTYNRPERCREVILKTAVALEQTGGEILVINNSAVAVGIPPLPAGVSGKEILTGRNLGAEARNLGWQAASGELILMLDDDAYIEPSLPPAMIQRFAGQPTLGCISFRIHNGKKEEACLLSTVFQGCSCGFRKSALQAIGGYPCKFIYYGEEYDVAFRLYAAGFRTEQCDEAGVVYHAREAAGRSLDRIIKLLVRNNVFLWFAYFPWAFIPGAVHDTLQRYRLVSAKEGAGVGYRQGLRQLPGAMLQGLLHRKPLSNHVFRTVSLVEPIRQACCEARKQGATRVIICGVGKFPSYWIGEAARAGLEIFEFWDFNTCWAGQSIRKIPVRVVDLHATAVSIPSDIAFISGVAAMSEASEWQQLIDCFSKKHRVVSIQNPILERPPTTSV